MISIAEACSPPCSTLLDSHISSLTLDFNEVYLDGPMLWNSLETLGAGWPMWRALTLECLETYGSEDSYVVMDEGQSVVFSVHQSKFFLT